MMHRRTPLIFVLGSTGTGKTKLAVDLCKRFNGEIVNTDSMQVYQGLPISTNKATDDEMQGVNQHLIDFIQPSVTSFNVLQFRDLALQTLNDIFSRGVLPVVVGCTSYYIEALLFDNLLGTEQQLNLKHNTIQATAFKDWYTEGLPSNLVSLSNEELHGELFALDRETAKRIHPNDRRRVQTAIQMCLKSKQPVSELLKQQRLRPDSDVFGGSAVRFSDAIMFFLNTHDRVGLNKRLDERIEEMIDRGLEQELTDFYDKHHDAHVAQLESLSEICEDLPADFAETQYTKGVFQSIGLKEFRPFLELSPCERQSAWGRGLFDKGVERMKTITRQCAKAQHKYVRNRLLKHPERRVPPIFELDVTDVSRWDENVAQPAGQITQIFLHDFDKLSDFDAYRAKIASEMESKQHLFLHQTRVIRCKYCNMQMSCEDDWNKHINSRGHKYTRSKTLRAQDLSTDISLDNNGRIDLDDENVDEFASSVS